MSRQHHYLKTWPNHFKDIESGKKTFEVRKNDRGYKEYDILHLQEYIPSYTISKEGEERFFYQPYTGREITKEVTYILDDPRFCKKGYVIMGLKAL